MGQGPDNVPVIGLCRFSLPTKTGYKRRFKTAAEQRAYLYDPARLALRFDLFETITLPSLQAQNDQDFRLLVVAGADLPDRWMTRLRDGVAGVSGAQLLAVEPGQEWSVFTSVFAEHMTGTSAPVLQFRLDDDDGLAKNFVGKLRQVAAATNLRQVLGKPVAINFTSGIDLLFDGTQLVGARRAHALSGSYGQAILTHQATKRSVYGHQHNLIWQKLPHVAVPGKPMFVRALHPDQDTWRGARDVPEVLDRDVTEKILQQRFGMSLAALEALRWTKSAAPP